MTESKTVNFSPKFVMTCRSSAAEIVPFPSLSKTRKASMISSSVSTSFIFRAMIVMKVGKSTVPSPLGSTSLMMSCSSASVGFFPVQSARRIDKKPSARITVPRSLVVMVPSPALSNREKASRYSAVCSSVNCSV